jgi:hypothetical protein
MNLNLTRVDTKIGLSCSMFYYIYLCKYVLIFISDNGIKGGLSTHRTGLSLQLLNVPVIKNIEMWNKFPLDNDPQEYKVSYRDRPTVFNNGQMPILHSDLHVPLDNSK